jgi:hypothetical protein
VDASPTAISASAAMKILRDIELIWLTLRHTLRAFTTLMFGKQFGNDVD